MNLKKCALSESCGNSHSLNEVQNNMYIYIHPRPGLQKKRRSVCFSLGWFFMVVFCPATSSRLIRKQMKSKLIVTSAYSSLGSQGIWTEVAFWDKGTWGVVTVMSSAWEVNRDMCWWLSALHWVCRMSDGSASCVFSILQVWAENYGASPPALWLWLMTI